MLSRSKSVRYEHGVKYQHTFDLAWFGLGWITYKEVGIRAEGTDKAAYERMAPCTPKFGILWVMKKMNKAVSAH